MSPLFQQLPLLVFVYDRFMAPEVFRHEQYNNKVDVYGFAMIAYQLFEGVPPFYTLDPVEAARAAALEHKRPQWGANKKGVVSSGT